MRKQKVGICSSYVRMPDGTAVLWHTVENLGEPDQKVVYYVSEEQTKEWRAKIIENAGRHMSSIQRTDEEFENLCRHG